MHKDLSMRCKSVWACLLDSESDRGSLTCPALCRFPKWTSGMKRTGWESRSIMVLSSVLSALLMGDVGPKLPFFPNPERVWALNSFRSSSKVLTKFPFFSPLNSFVVSQTAQAHKWFLCFVLSLSLFSTKRLYLWPSSWAASSPHHEASSQHPAKHTRGWLNRNCRTCVRHENFPRPHLSSSSSSSSSWQLAIFTLSQKTLIWAKALWMGLLLQLL